MGTKNLNSATDLITFTRASGGTALRKISYGSELVTNGDFATDISGWESSYGATPSEFDNGTIKLGHTAYNTWSRQVISGFVVGNTYQVKFSVTNDTQGGGGGSMVGMWENNSDSSDFRRIDYTRGAVETYTFDFTATATTSQIRLYKGGNTGATNFDNVSVKEVLFDQADGTLQLWNHSNNVPRIEYDATGAVKGLLIEEARTNLVTHSEDFSNASWVKQSGTTVTANQATSPASTTTADLVVGNGTSGIIYYAPTNTAGVVETFTRTVWIRSVTGTTTVKLKDPVFTTGIVSCNLTTDWQSFVLTEETTSNTVYKCGLWIDDIPASGIYLYGAQLEVGAFPTSYIPTSGSTATRAKDVAFIPVSDFGYNQKAGTVLVEFKSNKPLSEQFGAFVLHDGTPNNRIMHMTVPNHRGYVRTDSGTQADIAGGNRGATSELVKFAMAFAENDFAASAGGSSPSPDISGTVPSGITRLALGNWYQSFLGSYLNGHLKSIKYYPRRLTDTQLQELTT